MTVTLTATSGIANGATTCVMNKPAGTVAGTPMLIYAFGSSGVSANPAGFGAPKQTSANTGSDVWTQTAGGSEPSTYTITYSAAQHIVAVCVSFFGCPAAFNDPSSFPALYDPASSGTSISVPSITLVGSTDVLFGAFSAGQNAAPGTVSLPGGYTTLLAQFASGSASSDSAMIVGYKTGVAAGATGTQTGTSSNTEFLGGYILGIFTGPVPPGELAGQAVKRAAYY